jgi:hypothetical protein
MCTVNISNKLYSSLIADWMNNDLRFRSEYDISFKQWLIKVTGAIDASDYELVFDTEETAMLFVLQNQV